MRVLFLHQNMPGQFKHLAPSLARDPTHEVVFMTARHGVKLAGVRNVVYPKPDDLAPTGHHYLRRSENAIRYGQQVARACLELKRRGFVPDIAIGHTGWGETLFLKDIFPRTPLLGYCEFYYHASGADMGFLPWRRPSLDQICRTRMRNAHLLLGLESCDHAISPTQWQRLQHPPEFQHKISVIFDGVDTAAVEPNQDAGLELPDGRRLSAGDEVVTYVARDLEPYRGFAEFMRAVPMILERRPAAHVVVIGGNGNGYYGDPPPRGGSWRDAVLADIKLDPGRVHFLGRTPYATYLKVLQISAAHVYLTVPFVLSWSMLEAMAAGCLVIGSATPPVQEVIEHGRNGVLVDFFDSSAIAGTVCAALGNPAAHRALRQAARQTILGHYALTASLQQQRKLIHELAQAPLRAASAA